MAIIIDNSADRIARTSGVIDYNAAYTVVFWAAQSNGSSYRNLFAVGTNSTSDDHDWLGISDGEQLYVACAGGTGVYGDDLGSTVVPNGTAFCVALVRSSISQVDVYLGLPTSNLASELSVTNDKTGRTASSRMEMGGFTSFDIDTLNLGRVGPVKVWQAALTLPELIAEQWTIRPQRTADLYGWWPTFPGASERLLDYSGNGRAWTASGTLTDGEPFPVSWGAEIVYIGSPVSVAITGTITAKTQTVKANLTGVMQPSGVMAAVLQRLVFNATGAQPFTATISAKTRTPVFNGTGAQPFTATITAKTQSPKFNGTGAQPFTGTMTATLQRAVFNATGVMMPTGVIAALLQSPVFNATGEQEGVFSGTIAATLQSAGFNGTASQQMAGELVATIQTLLFNGTGSHAQIGALAATLQVLAFNATGSQSISGILAAAIQILQFNGTGTAPSEEIFALLRIFGLDEPITRALGLDEPVTRRSGLDEPVTRARGG